MAPTFMSDIGVDPNVFNESSDPKSDMTATVKPAVDLWVRLGRSWATVSTQTNYVYFKNYVDQRTLSSFNSMRLDVPFNRVRLFVGGGWVRARDRPGLDIDLRARHTQYLETAGIDVRLGGKSTLSASAERSKTTYEQGSLVFGTDLRDVLNREATRVTLGVQRALTPLTSLVVNANMQRDAFPGAPDRDNTITQVTAGLAFKPRALLTGGAAVGIMRVLPARDVGHKSQGHAISVDLGYTPGSSTKLALMLSRDVTYSADPAVPYSLLTRQTVAAVHRLSERWELNASASRSTLDYASSLVPNTHLNTYVAGIGCRLTPRLHVLLNVNRTQRAAAPGSMIGNLNVTQMLSSLRYGL